MRYREFVAGLVGCVTIISACSEPGPNEVLGAPLPTVTQGQIERLSDFPSQYVDARNVDVWLPPGYPSQAPYAVLYMHDGQMLFDANITWNKQEWRADEVAAALMAERRTRPLIIVGIANAGPLRHSEYFPQAPFEALLQAASDLPTPRSIPNVAKDVISDRYLKFLVEELKPTIDGRFKVSPAVEDTAVLGSSMGGLISWYAVTEYPDVFGAAGCMSTHWPGGEPEPGSAAPQAFLAYLDAKLPPADSHRFYFDFGTATLDQYYPPLQAKVDALMVKHGYTEAAWITRRFEGAEHSENAWNARLNIPFEFLLPPRNAPEAND